uniref:WD repeat domain phosphoinositide-interacting protein 3 n=1 Tax=Ditylenchus dipsaci TaxID=166011 RepID=A0A915CZS5_9BILA
MPSNDILSLNFNQDAECFVCGFTDGFRIFNANPLKQVQREDLDGAIGFAEMLFRCNYLALVGGGARPAFPPNKVIIWDCSLRKSVIELEMPQQVLAVRLRRDRIVVVLQCRIYVYSFSDIPVQLFEFETPENPLRLCALSTSVENSYLAFPSSSLVGSIELLDLSQKKGNPRQIKAHSHSVYVLAFNVSGTIVATASVKGTLIRLFEVAKGTMLKEFRRGSNRPKYLV